MYIIDIVQAATTEQIQSVVIDMAKLESWAMKIIVTLCSVIVTLFTGIGVFAKMIYNNWKTYSDQQTKLQIDTNKVISDNTNALQSFKQGLDAIPEIIQQVMEMMDLKKKA